MDSYLLVCVLAIFVAFCAGTIVPSKKEATETGTHVMVWNSCIGDDVVIILKAACKMDLLQLANLKKHLDGQQLLGIKFILLPYETNPFGLFELKNNGKDGNKNSD